MQRTVCALAMLGFQMGNLLSRLNSSCRALERGDLIEPFWAMHGRNSSAALHQSFQRWPCYSGGKWVECIPDSGRRCRENVQKNKTWVSKLVTQQTSVPG